MADNTVPGLGELIGLVSGGVTRSIGQFQRGVVDFLHAVDNFNKSMQQMQEITARVNSLLGAVEEPIRAAIPQITRAVNTADALMEQLSGPIEKVAPGLSKLGDTLATPALTRLPAELGEFMEAIGDMVAKMRPLSQIAESAGGLFGIRSFTKPTPPKDSPAPEPPPRKPPTKKAPAKKAARPR